MIQRFNTSKASQIMVEAVPDHLVDQYGIVDVALHLLKVKVL
jgi:UTP--glucose-1-phosphate uridylyltransferase